MKPLITDEGVWTQSSGVASPWQLQAGSDMSFVCFPDVGTAPFEALFIQIPVPLQLQEPVAEEELGRPHLSPDEIKLRQGLLALLTFVPLPDEPTDEDIGQRQSYRFPE